LEGVGGVVLKITFFSLAVSMFFVSPHVLATQIINRLDGRVLEVNEPERLLFVEFEHPVTGEFEQKKFYVATDAGFKHFKKLEKLNEGDLVSIDYYDHADYLKAIYVAYVPLKLAYTSKKEVAKALLKINGKKN
jgi:hypothetical protein